MGLTCDLNHGAVPGKGALHVMLVAFVLSNTAYKIFTRKSEEAVPLTLNAS